MNPSNPNRSFSPGTGVRGTIGNVLGGTSGSSSSSSSSSTPGANDVAFPNLIWVNNRADGSIATGSVNKPFPTIAAAIAAAPTDVGSTLMVAPGTYAEAGVTITDRDISIICLGGAEPGALAAN